MRTQSNKITYLTMEKIKCLATFSLCCFNLICVAFALLHCTLLCLLALALTLLYFVVVCLIISFIFIAFCLPIYILYIYTLNWAQGFLELTLECILSLPLYLCFQVFYLLKTDRNE